MPNCPKCRKALKKKKATDRLIHYKCPHCKANYVFDLITARMRRVTV